MLKNILAATLLALWAISLAPAQAQNYPKAKPRVENAKGYPTAGSRSTPTTAPGKAAPAGQTVTFLCQAEGTLKDGRLVVPLLSAIARWDRKDSLEILMTTSRSMPPTELPFSTFKEQDLWWAWERDYVDVCVGLGFVGSGSNVTPTSPMLWVSDSELGRGSSSSYFTPEGVEFEQRNSVVPQYVTVKRLDRNVGGVVQLEFKACPFGGGQVLDVIVNCTVVEVKP